MAIDAGVDDAQKVLREAASAGDDERLSILLNGWFRGIAAALEELAVELDTMRAAALESRKTIEPGEPRDAAPTETGGPEETPSEEMSATEKRREPDDEQALLARARASRAETSALRDR
jgi:hypothetical protein